MKMPRDFFDLAKEWKGYTSLCLTWKISTELDCRPWPTKNLGQTEQFWLANWLQEFQSKLYIFETALSRIDQTPILVYDIPTITVHYKSHFIALLQKKNIKSQLTLKYLLHFCTVERYRPGKHRNHSDFPEGDLQESRVAERVNMTTSRFYHGNVSLIMLEKINRLLCLKLANESQCWRFNHASLYPHNNNIWKHFNIYEY